MWWNMCFMRIKFANNNNTKMCRKRTHGQIEMSTLTQVAQFLVGLEKIRIFDHFSRKSNLNHEQFFSFAIRPILCVVFLNFGYFYS